MPLTVLVTGATGFVGSHLTRALVEEGHDVRAMTRKPDEYEGVGDPVEGDVFSPETLKGALRGVDVAYYLVHSLDDKDFVRKDAEAARAFGEAAAEAGVRQIIYLGGLGVDDTELSAHLRSRRQVESLLGEGGVPVTVLHGNRDRDDDGRLAGRELLLLALDPDHCLSFENGQYLLDGVQVPRRT